MTEKSKLAADIADAGETEERSPANARFTTSARSGDVILTLAPDQVIEHTDSWPTEEGWHSCTRTWCHEGDRVTLEVDSESQDCDGRVDHWAGYECPLADLRGRDPYPRWTRTGSRQRDHAAERAGY